MLCWNVCLVNIDRHGGVSDVDRFRDANVLSYDSICHDVCDLCHGALFHFFVLVASGMSYRDCCLDVFLDL